MTPKSILNDVSNPRLIAVVLAMCVCVALAAYHGASMEKRSVRMKWQYAPVLGTANDNSAAIVALDADGKVYVWSEGAEKLFGWRAEEMVGQTMHRLADPRLSAVHTTSFHKSMAADASRIHEVHCLAKRKTLSGQEEFPIYMIVMASPPQGAVALIMDETKVSKLSSGQMEWISKPDQKAPPSVKHAFFP